MRKKLRVELSKEKSEILALTPIELVHMTVDELPAGAMCISHRCKTADIGGFDSTERWTEWIHPDFGIIITEDQESKIAPLIHFKKESDQIRTIDILSNLVIVQEEDNKQHKAFQHYAKFPEWVREREVTMSDIVGRRIVPMRNAEKVVLTNGSSKPGDYSVPYFVLAGI